MSGPRTYAQLRLQWLQRIVRDYEPPEAQFEAEALQTLRFAFRYAIDDVQDLLRDPERDRDEVLVALRPLSMSRLLVRQEDVPALMELARTAREVRGPGSQYIEGAALEALVEVADEDALPFLAECFRYSRPRDSLARHRRTIVLKAITAIAVLTRNEDALALLEEALTHKTWRVRQVACRAIREVGGMSAEGLPPQLIERLRYVARNDKSRDVRVSAQLAYVLLGSLQARLDAARDHYWAEVPALGDNYVRVSQRVLHDFGDTLLTGGAWGTMTIEYDARYELGGRIYPFFIREFKPFQITRLDLEDYKAKRRLFTDEEWIDLLITSIGFNPAQFDQRVKMLFLLRLVPFVEPNYNLIELGPRETGKTYTYRNTSSRSFVISGGKATPATLFYNLASRKIGILGYRDVIFFDEVANTRFGDPEATISILKDFMQTGRFSRGPLEFSSAASIVLGGNIDTDLERRQPVDRYVHLFEVLPAELQDTAFIDRIHAFLPGWELPKIQPENYAQGYGFITDYLAEIFVRLRRLTHFLTAVQAQANFEGLTGRNQTAIAKTASGLLKLIYPHRTADDLQSEELALCLDLAAECRERVIHQLAIMAPEEFKPVRFELLQKNEV